MKSTWTIFTVQSVLSLSLSLSLSLMSIKQNTYHSTATFTRIHSPTLHLPKTGNITLQIFKIFFSSFFWIVGVRTFKLFRCVETQRTAKWGNFTEYFIYRPQCGTESSEVSCCDSSFIAPAKQTHKIKPNLQTDRYFCRSAK